MAAATADRPNSRSGPRRGGSSSCHSSWRKCTSGRVVGHVATVGQDVLGAVVFGPGQRGRRLSGRNRRRGGGGSGSGRCQRGGRVDDPAAVRDQRRALGRGELRVRRGNNGCPQVLGESLGDQRNAGTTTDGRDSRDACRGHAVALQRFVKRRKEFRERSPASGPRVRCV